MRSIRPRFLLAVAGSTFALAVALNAAGVDPVAPVAVTTVVSGPPAAAPAQASAQVPVDMVGSDTCLACHFAMDKGVAGSAHGNAALPGSPAAEHGCESCHGPGALHVQDPTQASTIKRFGSMASREVNDTCLSCHTSASHALWDGGAHDARNLSCATCHSVHEPQSPTGQLKTATEMDTCETCHRAQVLKVKRVSHMPVTEGKMECSTCHSPHGATNVKLLRVGNWVNESCIACHTEKRGPFLFEHAAGRESCVSCHDPHGSSNDRMLVARAPMLCQRCHIGTRHPSTIYDNAAVTVGSNRIIGRSCINCHQQIHGSNHPSGQSLTR